MLKQKHLELDQTTKQQNDTAMKQQTEQKLTQILVVYIICLYL